LYVRACEIDLSMTRAFVLGVDSFCRCKNNFWECWSNKHFPTNFVCCYVEVR